MAGKRARESEAAAALGNAFTHDELREFDKRVKRGLETDEEVEYFAELKFDGASISLTYVDGRFEIAVSRLVSWVVRPSVSSTM